MDSLALAIKAEPAYLPELAHLVEDVRFATALQVVVTQRGLIGADQRLLRNARAMVVTATAAANALRAIDGARGAREELRQALETAIRLLDDGTRTAGRYRPALHLPGLRDAAMEVQDAIQAIRTPGVAHAAARYWTLYWIDRVSPGKHNRLPELIRDNRSIPAASASIRSAVGILFDFQVQTVAGGELAQLFEHPENALFCIGPKLYQSIQRAWSLIERPPAICWRLNGQAVAAHDGDSLSGAAALVIRALSSETHILTRTLVLARVARDGVSIEPVEGLREKLDAATLARIDTVIIGAGADCQPVARRDRVTLTENELTRFGKVMRILIAGNLEEAFRLARGFEDPSAASAIGGYDKLELKHRDSKCQTWVARKDGENCLLKIWPFKPEEELFWRTDWDRELRTLYRVCTSAKAEKSLISLRDAFIDRTSDVFAMAFHSEGLSALSEALVSRENYSWLRNDTLGVAGERATLWSGLKRIAQGVVLLHQQQIVHRNICAENVYFDTQPESFRLGGFAWSMRLAGKPGESEISSWATPPEFGERQQRYTIDTDWYGFGMLIARCFFWLEPLAEFRPVDLNRAVRSAIIEDRGILSPAEHELILRLIETKPDDRLCEHDEILRLIDDLLRDLNTGIPFDSDTHEALYVVFNHKNDELRKACEDHGFVPNVADRFISYSDNNKRHNERLKTHLKEQFASAVLYRLAGGELCLAGKSYFLRIACDKPDPRAQETWDFVFATYAGPFNLPKEHEERRLEGVPVHFIFPNETRDWLEHRNWRPYLPEAPAEVSRSNRQIERFKRFLRFTNQLELLMRRAEIFPCLVAPMESQQFRRQFVKVVERSVPGRVPEFCELGGGMTEYFQRDKDSNKRDAGEALLTKTQELLPDFDDASWTVEEVQGAGPTNPEGSLILSRADSGDAPPLGEMFVRATGYKGQIELIERRRRAIDRMEDHTYLLRALLGMVWMDTRQADLQYVPPEDKVDRYKTAVMIDVLRARPIYALQGPPGTGKTTLVSHLLREILKDDPSAQVLVTAQAHGAVDVLRAKVSEAFVDVPVDERPVTVRLGGRADQDFALRGTPNDEASRVLKLVLEQYEGESTEDPIVKDWLELVRRLALPGRSPEDDGNFEHFSELVLRGANFVYCTTSAGDLEEIATSNQSFDWTVIEEAGKVHGFDLALPMQAGHRWLLVGDQYQLAPYRSGDFRKALSRDFDASVSILQGLARTERRLVDDEWMDVWEEIKDNKLEVADFRQFCDVWLRTFDRLYRVLKEVTDEELITKEETPAGAAVGLLTRQYRMHPDIGELVSTVYYKNELHSETQKDGAPLARVCHGLVMPESLRDCAIVWIDVPWCKQDMSFKEKGPPQANRYSSPAEVAAIESFLAGLRFGTQPKEGDERTIALLSPYNEQVAAITRMVRRKPTLPPGLRLQESIYHAVEDAGARRKAHTVDSFQGNQADIVIVSLVRNNLLAPIKGLGFLTERERMNVLLSRAERLLVLVGSWDFFEAQLANFSAEEDDDNIETVYTFGHLVKATRLLRRMFRDGRAVRLLRAGNDFIVVPAPTAQAGGG